MSDSDGMKAIKRHEARRRIAEALARIDAETIVDAIEAACVLNSVLYAADKLYAGGEELFQLRKSLEGIFGHDVPDADDLGWKGGAT